MVASEATTLRLRAGTQYLGFVRSVSFQLGLHLRGALHEHCRSRQPRGRVGFIFSDLSAAAFAALLLEVPETNDRSYVELDDQFERRAPTRKV